jgi:excisionase family DNA binding protein
VSIRPRLDPGRLYKASEIAEIANVHVETVRRWLRFGQLPARKVGGQWFIYGGDLIPEDLGSPWPE